MISDTGNGERPLNIWKTKPSPLAADAGKVGLGQVRDINALEQIAPGGGTVEGIVTEKELGRIACWLR